MQSTAVRTLNQINSKIVQNSRKWLASCDVTRLASAPKSLQKTCLHCYSTDHPESIKNAPSRHSVGRRRNLMTSKPSNVNEINFRQDSSSDRGIILQPSKMKSFYCPKDDVAFPHMDEQQLTGVNSIKESKTRSNLVLPLKALKLANPFPDPVKVMVSHTVSDEEKAQQLFAESKNQRTNSSDWGRLPTSARNYSTMSPRLHVSKLKSAINLTRRYSTDKESGGSTTDTKCKKLKKEEKATTCPKWQLECCEPPARKFCEWQPLDPNCKKQEAPYPAYSEFCHEDLDEKPSECKLCPWKYKDPESPYHPTFKPKKKKFHTLSMLSIRNTGMDTINEVDEIVSRINGGKPRQVPLKTGPAEEGADGDIDGMLCDLKKEPCKKPPPRPCEKKKEKPKPPPPKKKKCKSAFAEEDGALVEPSSIEHSSTLVRLLDKRDGAGKLAPPPPSEDSGLSSDEMSLQGQRQKKHKRSPRDCPKKFPFVPCPDKDPPKTRKSRRKVESKCPPKIRGPYVEDCPPTDDEKKCDQAISSLLPPILEPPNKSDRNLSETLQLRKEKKDEDEKKKCPKVDMSIEEPEERCPPTRRGTSKTCPTDLTEKKRFKKKKPAKKTSRKEVPIIPIPPMSTPENPASTINKM